MHLVVLYAHVNSAVKCLKIYIRGNCNVRNKDGFTLLEMMIVLGIASILTAIAVPNFIGWLPNYRLRAAADDLTFALQLARMRAARENAIATVAVDLLNDKYIAFVDDGRGDGIVGDGVQNGMEVIFRAGEMPAGIQFVDKLNFTKPGEQFKNVRFDGRGHLDSSQTSIYIANQQQKKVRIALSNWGRINLTHI